MDLGDVKVVKEGGPQIERGMVFLRDTCHCFFFHRNISGKRLPREGCSDQGDVKEEKAVKRVLPWALTKWTKHIVTFNEDEDEDILVEDGPQIDRGTVFHRDTCHREIYQRNIRDKRLPREACLHLGDVKVEQDIVTFNEDKEDQMKTREISWRKDLKLKRGTVFLRDTCDCFFFFTETLVTSDCRVKGALTRAMSKRRNPL